MASEKVKKDALRRAKIVEGHLKKVTSMIESDEYCIDILNQSLAVQNALKKIDELILEDHLNGCVVHQIQNGQAKDAAREVLEVFRRKS